MGKTTWVCTVVTQISLCFALYVALNLGQPQNFIKRSGSTPLDLFFISVNGGFRPLQQQFDLLKQMEKMAKTYKVGFIVSSSELGEDDPLMQNATQQFPSLRLPWYTTCSSRASEEQEVGCFKENITISNGKTLDIIGVDTELLHKDSALRGSVSGNNSGKNQLHWLIRTLETSTSNWRIVIGYQPLVACGENKEQMEKQRVFKYLQHIFMKFAVNVYLSGQDCSNHVHEGSVAYIGNPSLNQKEPYSVFLSGSSFFSRDLANGFLLHRVNSEQIVTYYITSAGEVVYKTVLQQRGREVM
ncbi:Metallo-dependent phosphatase-like [Senna tora]|uniref:Metallo-dependent phosphatase-like n=1 Tax=Senna tora TaxID=362788 RepID=A0A834W284_9FABA|nr:Metallo-dependent phosphatase-like [Senna tora]